MNTQPGYHHEPAHPAARKSRAPNWVRLLGTILVSTVLYLIGITASLIAIMVQPFAMQGDMASNLAVLLTLFAMLAWVSVYARKKWPLVTFCTGAVILIMWGEALLMLIGLFHITVRAATRTMVIATISGIALSIGSTIRMCFQPVPANPFSIVFLPESGTWEPGSITSDITLATQTATIGFMCIALGITLGVGHVLRREARIKKIENRSRQQAQDNSVLATQVAHQSERARLAQELHDTMAHRLSLVSLHAGALEVKTPPTSATHTKAQVLRQEAHAALQDLRSLIDDVRQGDMADQPGAASAQEPQLGAASLESIATLVESVAHTGTPIYPTIIIQDAPLAPTKLHRSAYRVVQEALTNALKHAPGQAITLTVRVAAHTGVHIHVANPLGPATPTAPSQPLPAAVPPKPTALPGSPTAQVRAAVTEALAATGSGRGVEGIRARAEMLGATCWIGQHDQMFIVDVRFPPFTQQQGGK